MTPEQLIAHLTLHGWEPVKYHQAWIGLGQEGGGLVYLDSYGTLVKEAPAFYAAYHDVRMSIDAHRCSWDDIEGSLFTLAHHIMGGAAWTVNK